MKNEILHILSAARFRLRNKFIFRFFEFFFFFFYFDKNYTQRKFVINIWQWRQDVDDNETKRKGIIFLFSGIAIWRKFRIELLELFFFFRVGKEIFALSILKRKICFSHPIPQETGNNFPSLKLVMCPAHSLISSPLWWKPIWWKIHYRRRRRGWGSMCCLLRAFSSVHPFKNIDGKSEGRRKAKFIWWYWQEIEIAKSVEWLLSY